MKPYRGKPYRGKRIVDLALLAVFAVPAAITGVVAALGVRFTSSGPILYRQERVGLHGQRFVCLKFRTMIDAENPFTPDEDRITVAGRWLRKFALDELPQFVNVARGEMSFVGPRPMLPFQAERCVGDQRERFNVRPGLTGLAQISGRNAITWPERIEIDLDYVRTQSPRVDLRIVASTPVALLSGSGATGHDGEDPFVVDPPSP